MPKPPAGREPDPMARVVDRLLAQLPGLQGGHDPSPATPRRSPPPGNYTFTAAPAAEPPGVIGLWGRVVLGLMLGTMMTAWPYFRECGLPLFGYLSATIVVVLAGGWIAVTAWRLRNEVAHVLALLLTLWGLVLTADVLLPRMGYAAVTATWQCGEPNSGPSWMRWFAPPAA